MLIKGITVTLYERTKIGVDAFGAAVFSETAVSVDNVLVHPKGDSSEIIDRTNLNGTKTTYELCIPKGDTHEWRGNRVEFFGQSYKVGADEIQYIDELTPLSWNRKVWCERIE